MSRPKTFQITHCPKCERLYAMSNKCPPCDLVESGRTLKVVSMSGGAVHDWHGSAAFPAQCITQFKSRTVMLPPDAIVTCRFCNPWPMTKPDLWKPSETDKKMARDLPTIEEVRVFVGTK